MANDLTISKALGYVVTGGPEDRIEISGGKVYVVTAIALDNLAIQAGKAYLVTTPQTGDLAGIIDIDVVLSATLDTATGPAPSGSRRRFMIVAGA